MRIAAAVLLACAPAWACSCVGKGTPCSAAGISDAVFTGIVLDILDPPPPQPVPTAGPQTGRRTASQPPLPFPQRTIRIRVGEVLSGIGMGQQEVEVLTGKGGGDCGFPFQPGVDYIVYANKNADGKLTTGICTRTRTLADAAEDLAYLHSMAGAPPSGNIRVRVGTPPNPAKADETLIAENSGTRYAALTNGAGDAVFNGVPPGEYTIHSQTDGDLPDDPKTQLHAKGCVEVFFQRTLRISGRVTTAGRQPVPRIEVQYRSTQNQPGDTAIVDADGYYKLRITKPGQYYLGINLNNGPSRFVPYPRWYYPGTQAPEQATVIDFSGKPEFRAYDLTLPDPQPERIITGIAIAGDGRPMARVTVSALDFANKFAGQAFSDQNGRFTLNLYTGTSYRIHAVMPGPGQAVSAVPQDVPAGSQPLDLTFKLDQPGNSVLEAIQGRLGVR
ncbi:MAG: carboxypeptidase regulatory-like domain-containing protein [Bryobacterales bacterium]|nr:carboxypeptidase regulatory-like domain-containing protein [Bryobacterales bacterium]